LCTCYDHAINSCPYACYAQPNFASPIDNTDIVLSLHDSSFPLAQHKGLEVGEHFGVFTRFDVVDACFESEDTLDVVHNLVRTPFKGCRDMFVHKDFPSLDFNNIVSPNSVDHTHVSPTYSQPFISLEYSLDAPIDNPNICDTNNDLGYEDNMFSMLGENVDNFLSLGYFCVYDASLDPYCMYLVDKPRKIM